MMMGYTVWRLGVEKGQGPHVCRCPSRPDNPVQLSAQLLPMFTGMLGPGNQSSPLTFFFLSSSQSCREVFHD